MSILPSEGRCRNLFGSFLDYENDNLYLIGGANTYTYDKIDWVSKYEIKKEKWTYLPCLNAERMGAGSIKCLNNLFVFGDEQNSFERLSL